MRLRHLLPQPGLVQLLHTRGKRELSVYMAASATHLTWSRITPISKDGVQTLIIIGLHEPIAYSGCALLIASISLGWKLGWLLNNVQFELDNQKEMVTRTHIPAPLARSWQPQVNAEGQNLCLQDDGMQE